MINTINTSNVNKNKSILETSPSLTENNDKMFSKSEDWVTGKSNKHNHRNELSEDFERGNIMSTNRYRHLVIDDHSNFDDEIEANIGYNSSPAAKNPSTNCNVMRPLKKRHKSYRESSPRKRHHTIQ